jgi:ParB family transcriptional regulator, chromosome partitioning protein
MNKKPSSISRALAARGLGGQVQDTKNTDLGDVSESRPTGGPNSKSKIIQRTIPLEMLIPNQGQPRKYFDPQALKELTADIEAHGVLQSLLVRPHPSGKFEIIAGERRYRAAQQSSLVELPCIVQERDDTATLEVALAENLNREDLNPIEYLTGMLSLLAVKLNASQEEVIAKLYQVKNDTATPADKETIHEVFARFGKTSANFIKNILPLRNLPEDVFQAVQSGVLEYSKALVLKSVSDDRLRAELLARACDPHQPMSREDLLAALKPKEPSKDLKVEALKARVVRKFRPNASIVGTASKGYVKIPYSSQKELEELLK